MRYSLTPVACYTQHDGATQKSVQHIHPYYFTLLLPKDIMDSKQLKTPGRYKHYKGNLYDVYEVATHSEDESKLVVYRPCYGEKALWVRPLDMFVESVEKDGETLPRFAYVGNIPDDEKMI